MSNVAFGNQSAVKSDFSILGSNYEILNNFESNALKSDALSGDEMKVLSESWANKKIPDPRILG